MLVQNNLTRSGNAALSRGISVIAHYVKTLPNNPGVYRMINANDDVLYVGKAKDLKKRVVSYTQPMRLPIRLQRMIAETSRMEFVTTHTETEALLLEANFIKKLSPRYNILLKDSKYFSYICITNHEWPRLMKYRGPKNPGDQYFGPFASAEAVNHSLVTLHKVFQLRACSDPYFTGRKRPCMQYHIKRCSAPCTNYVEPELYKQAVKSTVEFLQGKTHKVQQEIAQHMEQASTERHYEHAAMYRDQIKALTQLQSQQTINTTLFHDADIFGLYQIGHQVCIQVFFFRTGSNYGSFSLFPKHTDDLSPSEILNSIIPLFYEDKDPPSEILLSHELPSPKVIEQAFRERIGHSVNISAPKRGAKMRFLEHAVKNAREALERNLAREQSQKRLLSELAQLFGIDKPLNRIEVYDNSHIQGQDAIGAMIVVGPEGFQKKSYRKFTIRNASITRDDYGMMREVLHRRFSGSLAENQERNPPPDLLLIDGGQGQVNVVVETLAQLNISIPIVGIAKGPQRNAGRETFYRPDKPSFTLEQQPHLLYFLQRIRDESHRFAIGTHRAKRMKRITDTTIGELPGIGPARKKALLLHFGSSKAVENARVEDLEKVEGISNALAHKIYGFFHNA